MTFELPCLVRSVGATKSTPKGWRFRELLVEDDDPRYPQVFPIQFSGDRCALLDGVRAGDFVRVAFDLSGREWEGKHYVTIRGWRVQRRGGDGVYRAVEVSSSNADPGLFDNSEKVAKVKPKAEGGDADLDSLPF